jgi:nitroimidazol reductase NimA-like FMN-containing flavoprotein (pyridoxamine 5'-phosphate oxidase superfamily)
LASDEIGRLAVVAGNTAIVLPVNYALDGETVVFRTDPGTKLDHGPRARASFEVDSFDRDRRTGWSVVATGRLEEVTPYDAATYERVRRLPVDPWAGGDKAHWMRLVPDRVTGRRIRDW